MVGVSGVTHSTNHCQKDGRRKIQLITHSSKLFLKQLWKCSMSRRSRRLTSMWLSIPCCSSQLHHQLITHLIPRLPDVLRSVNFDQRTVPIQCNYRIFYHDLSAQILWNEPKVWAKWKNHLQKRTNSKFYIEFVKFTWKVVARRSQIWKVIKMKIGSFWEKKIKFPSHQLYPILLFLTPEKLKKLEKTHKWPVPATQLFHPHCNRKVH